MKPDKNRADLDVRAGACVKWESMAFGRVRQIQTLLRHVRPAVKVHASPCHHAAKPFHGSIEHVSSSWAPEGKLKEHQDSLPCQPVPPLGQTMERFLNSVRPLLNDEKYQRAVKLTTEFSKPGGDGERLQTLLQERADSRENWLADWWIRVAYLGYRDPAQVYVNPLYVGPYMEQYKGAQGRLRCTAICISSVIEWRGKIDSQNVPIEKIGKTPQCMIQYYHVLGCCRVPGDGVDQVVSHHTHDPTAPKHVTVFCNNNIFQVEVYDDNWQPLNVDQIESQLAEVERLSQTRGAPIGALTSAQRDEWYRAYAELRQDPQNAANLDSIHSSLFTVSLDEEIPGYTVENHYDVVAQAQMSGGGIDLNTGNRWCDKQLQFSCNRAGMFGFQYEHSIAEGPAVVAIYEQVIKNIQNPPPMAKPASGNCAPPQKLSFNLSPLVTETIETAARNINSIAKDVDFTTLRFTGYGRDFIKQMKIPPDGYVQAQIQLAYYKMYGHLVSTYESGSLRKYRLGRTETIRSASIPVLKFCQAMVDKKTSAAEKVRLLQESAQHHRWYTNQVVEGQAIDRHLLGLKLTALEHDLDMPEFLKDPLYNMSCHWNLSTTTVPIVDGVIFFGPVVNDGYGVYYNTQKKHIDFGLSAWNTAATTDVRKFRESLESALADTYEVCLQQTKL